MKYAVEIGSGVMVYIPSFIKIGSEFQKLMGVGDLLIHKDIQVYRHTDSMEIAQSFV
jgi:hypothetical protein